MRTCYCLSFLIWTSMLHEVHASPSPKRTNMYLQVERVTGTPKDHGKALHRTKRGWMWNQFFLLEEYTGPDTQYVGKAETLGIPVTELQCPFSFCGKTAENLRQIYENFKHVTR